MELDDLKQALGRLERQLDEQVAMTAAQGRREFRNRLQDSLRPLDRAQNWLIVAGLVTALLGVSVWYDTPDRMGVFASGVILHFYGIAMIIFGAVTKVLVSKVDWAGPVVAIQNRLAQLRKANLLGVIVIGLSWFVLWIPALAALCFLAFGDDIIAAAPSAWSMLAAGGALLAIAGGAFLRWASAAGRQSLAGAVGRFFANEHLIQAETEIEYIQRFERD